MPSLQMRHRYNNVMGMLSEKLRVIYTVVTKAWLDWPRDCNNGNVKQASSDRTAVQVALRELFDFMDGVKGIKIHLPQVQHLVTANVSIDEW
jgi:hypothetical protein